MDLKELLGDAYKEGMTFEEAEAVLKGIAPPAAPDSGDLTRLKADLAKANAAAAKYKEQLRGKQSEAEAAAAAQKEEYDRLVQENADLKRTASISAHKAQLAALGYDEKLAEATAIAMTDGDTAAVLANQKTFLVAREQEILAGKMRQTPRPAAGGGTGGPDYSKLIQEAQTAGDMSAAAYYTRLSQTAAQAE